MELLKGPSPRSRRFRRRNWVISATDGKAMNTAQAVVAVELDIFQVNLEITNTFRFLFAGSVTVADPDLHYFAFKRKGGSGSASK